jgi:hypothetical protein
MAKSTTLQDKVAQNAALMASQKKEPVQKLASSQGLMSAPVTAYGTSLIGGSPEQAKMAGTPAQKGAAIAKPFLEETALSQAEKLRAPAMESPEDKAKKDKAALLTRSLGTFGAKVNDLVESAFTNIVGKKDQVQPAQVQFKLNTASEKLKNLAGTALTTVTDLIGKIAAETDPAKKNELTNSLNTALGLTTIDSQLRAEEVPGLISSIPETVQETAQAGIKKAVGDKLTVSDVGSLGTSYGELAGLLGVSEDEVKNFTVGELQNQLSALAQQTFAPVQEVQAGLSSGLLSAAERASLRQSLTAMQETGTAGAALQLESLVDDIDKNAQVKVGDTMYSVDELLGSEAMTDIVKQVIEDPEGKLNPFVKSLQKDEPELYKWIVGSKDSLQQLVTGAQAGVAAYQTLQETNRKLLEPLQGQKGFFKDLGLDVDKLSSKEIKLTDLPASAQYVLNQKPEARQSTASRIAQLGKDNIKDLTADQLAKLQPENPDGPAAQWLAAKSEADKAASLTSPQDVINEYTNNDIDLANMSDFISTSNLAAALGFDGGNAAELDVAPPYGQFDEKDAAILKQRMTNIPSLADVAAGKSPVPPKSSFQFKAPAPLSGESQEVLDTMKRVFADQFFTQEEADALPWSEEKMQSVLNNLPRVNGRYVKRGADIARTLQEAIDRKRKVREDAEVAAENERIKKEAEQKAAEKEAKKKEGERRVPESGASVLSKVARGLGIKAR